MIVRSMMRVGLLQGDSMKLYMPLLSAEAVRQAKRALARRAEKQTPIVASTARLSLIRPPGRGLSVLLSSAADAPNTGYA